MSDKDANAASAPREDSHPNPVNFPSSAEKAREEAVLNAVEQFSSDSLETAAEEDGEDVANSSTTSQLPPNATAADFEDWTDEQFAALSAEDLAALPDDLRLVPKEQTEAIWEAMHDVVDPELGVNVVDLGLVYDVHCDIAGRATVNMTLTSPACPLTDVLEDQAFMAVCAGGHARALRINWVWMPPWGPHMITDDGREQLRALGFTL